IREWHRAARARPARWGGRRNREGAAPGGNAALEARRSRSLFGGRRRGLFAPRATGGLLCRRASALGRLLGFSRRSARCFLSASSAPTTASPCTGRSRGAVSARATRRRYWRLDFDDANRKQFGRRCAGTASATGRASCTDTAAATARAHAKTRCRGGRCCKFRRGDRVLFALGQLLGDRLGICSAGDFEVVAAAAQIDQPCVMRILENANEHAVAEAVGIAAEELARAPSQIAGADRRIARREILERATHEIECLGARQA